MEPDHPVQLSVVMAGGGDDGAALDAVRASCADLITEIIRVSPGAAATPADADVRVVAVSPGALVPEQWGAGAAVARGSVVAFTTTDVTVGAGWARALFDAVSRGASGAAGEIRLASHAPPHVRGVYFTRYSAYAPPVKPGPVSNIPADNGAYARWVCGPPEALADGFWEVEAHHRLPPNAGSLCLIEGACAVFSRAPRPLAFCRQRFRHARRFGTFRVRELGQSRLRIVAAAPLVPLLLLLRAGRRTVGRPALRWPFLTALPLMTLYACSWAFGEAVGAVAARK